MHSWPNSQGTWGQGGGERAPASPPPSSADHPQPGQRSDSWSSKARSVLGDVAAASVVAVRDLGLGGKALGSPPPAAPGTRASQ